MSPEDYVRELEVIIWELGQGITDVLDKSPEALLYLRLSDALDNYRREKRL